MAQINKDLADLRVLIVEDQADSRALIRHMLSEIGITQIFDASDGRQAMQFMDTAFDFIDLVICDWNMPGMSGVEVLRQLRSVDPNFPFLMVTGRADKDSVVEAKASGVTGYIAKPFSSTQLEAKLRVIAAKMEHA
jgi:two-component system chemotaxis response regulator CheY